MFEGDGMIACGIRGSFFFSLLGVGENYKHFISACDDILINELRSSLRSIAM